MPNLWDEDDETPETEPDDEITEDEVRSQYEYGDIDNDEENE